MYIITRTGSAAHEMKDATSTWCGKTLVQFQSGKIIDVLPEPFHYCRDCEKKIHASDPAKPGDKRTPYERKMARQKIWEAA